MRDLTTYNRQTRQYEYTWNGSTIQINADTIRRISENGLAAVSQDTNATVETNTTTSTSTDEVAESSGEYESASSNGSSSSERSTE